jgi:hypothetical protein
LATHGPQVGQHLLSSLPPRKNSTTTTTESKLRGINSVLGTILRKRVSTGVDGLERLHVSVLHGQADNRLTEFFRPSFTETMAAFGTTALQKNQGLRVSNANRAPKSHVDCFDQLTAADAYSITRQTV